MPPGVSPSMIPGNESPRLHNPILAELKAKDKTLTVQEVLDFLHLVTSAHPETLKRELNYCFDGEFYNFARIVFEGETIVLCDET